MDQATRDRYSVTYTDGRVDRSNAPDVRLHIAVQERKIAQAFCRGNMQLATRYANELAEFKALNNKYLIPSWPAVR
jgi:hypothetical protein